MRLRSYRLRRDMVMTPNIFCSYWQLAIAPRVECLPMLPTPLQQRRWSEKAQGDARERHERRRTGQIVAQVGEGLLLVAETQKIFRSRESEGALEVLQLALAQAQTGGGASLGVESRLDHPHEVAT